MESVPIFRLLLVELGSRLVIFINSERLRRKLKFSGNLASAFEPVRVKGAIFSCHLVSNTLLLVI